MKTVLEILNLSTDHLKKCGIANAAREAEHVVADSLDLKRIDLFLQFERPLNQDEIDACRNALIRRSKGEPSQYIKGFVDFYDCSIKVSPAVLIPRNETEILVDKIAKTIASDDVKGKVFLDLCCGSGCIGIALKKKFPLLDVYLSDISEAALVVAEENAKSNEVEVSILQGDLFAPFSERKADYIVCNPPYIAESEYASLEREVRDFEPKMALISGETGFEFYERLANSLAAHLNPGAKVWFEMGTKQAEQVKNLFNRGKYKKIEVENDWAGHNRFFFLEIE